VAEEDMDRADYVVLDEADRMLDKGFENDIRRIMSGVKSERQTMMCEFFFYGSRAIELTVPWTVSATWPEGVRQLASTLQRDVVRVTVGSEDLKANRRVEQVVEVLDDGRWKE